MRKCGKCGEPGHNARTCSKVAPKAAKPKGRACGNCGEVGHNRRTCPGVVEEVAEPIVEKTEIKTKRKRKPKVCSVCYEEGHTKKSCMYAVEIEGPIGPSKMDCGHFTWWLKDDKCELCNRMENLKDRNYAE